VWPLSVFIAAPLSAFQTRTVLSEPHVTSSGGLTCSTIL
jgi:hypothetical protein